MPPLEQMPHNPDCGGDMYRAEKIRSIVGKMIVGARDVAANPVPGFSIAAVKQIRPEYLRNDRCRIIEQGMKRYDPSKLWKFFEFSQAAEIVMKPQLHSPPGRGLVALVEGGSDFERIPVHQDEPARVAEVGQSPGPQWQQQANARILEDNCRRLAE
jgi:hypothetical protein